MLQQEKDMNLYSFNKVSWCTGYDNKGQHFENREVVHVHNTLNLVSPAVYYAAKAMKVPVVQTIHNFRLLCPGATFYRDGHICEDCVEHGYVAG